MVIGVEAAFSAAATSVGFVICKLLRRFIRYFNNAISFVTSVFVAERDFCRTDTENELLVRLHQIVVSLQQHIAS